MEQPYDIHRTPQADGVDYVLIPHDDAEFPVQGERLLLGVAVLIALSMFSSAVAVAAQVLTARGLVVGFPWWAVVIVGAVILAVLGLHQWVFGLDDGTLRVALRHHHVSVEGKRIELTALDAVEVVDATLVLRHGNETVHLPAFDEAMLRDIKSAVAGAQPASPPEALDQLRAHRTPDRRETG